MDEILLLWDIDGVFNVHGRGEHWNGEWIHNTVAREECPALFEHFPEKFQSLDLRVNQDFMDSFSSLNLPHITHKWLTAWEQDAATIFAPKVGFTQGEKWEAIVPVMPESEVWWKTEAVRNIMVENPSLKVIWMDDLIDSTDAMESDNRDLNEDFPGRLAMVGVMSHQGVTPDTFNFIKRLATDRWQAGMFLFE